MRIQWAIDTSYIKLLTDKDVPQVRLFDNNSFDILGLKIEEKDVQQEFNEII